MKRFLISFVLIVLVAMIAGVVHYGLDRANEKAIRFSAPPKNTTTITIPPKGGDKEVDEDPADEGPEDSAPEPEREADPEPEPPVSDPDPVDEPVAFNPDEIDCTTMTLEPEISLEQAWCLFDNELAIFIDARPRDEYEAGHIRDALSIRKDSFQNGEPIGLGLVGEGQYVVVYCAGGHCEDSHFVAEDIAFFRPDLEPMIYIYKDGYQAWADAGLPTAAGPDPFSE